MRDNELIRLFLPIIQTGLENGGYTGITIKQANQPTQQGINTNPTVYFFKVGDKRYGFLRRNSEYTNGRMVHTEVQQYETTFQISALVIQNPNNPYSYTASDLVNEIAAIMQSDYAVTTLVGYEVGVLRVTEVRNPYFLDDKDQFEASPSFDFVLTHKQTRVSVEPMINSIQLNINRV